MLNQKVPAVSYALRIVPLVLAKAGLTNLAAGDIYIKPDAMTFSLSCYGTTNSIEKAASFPDTEKAQAYWNQISRKYSANYTAEIVRVESVPQKTVEKVDVMLNYTSPHVFYVLTTSAWGEHKYRTPDDAFAKDAFAKDVAKAERFSSISDALKRLVGYVWTRKSSEVDGIEAYNEITTYTFKITKVSDAVIPQFTVFTVVNSSVISELAYDHLSKLLRIKMKKGGSSFSTNGEPNEASATYEYANVDAADVFAFVAAQSKGRHYSTVFKKKYDQGSTKL